MLTVASLLAAMTIAGAFWVGVLAARRLRDWGEGRRALEEGASGSLAIAAVSGAPPDDAHTRRVRALVADRLRGQRLGAPIPRAMTSATGEPDGAPPDLSVDTLRPGDVVIVSAGESDSDGDYIVEGVVNLREGADATSVVNLVDGSRKRWLVAGRALAHWMMVEPVSGHGLSGEPPRNIRRDSGLYSLQRRGQASVATIGRHGRPDTSRVATYVYEASLHEVLWLERWGHEVLLGQGRTIDDSAISLLPGS
ncbi:MAG: DUF4178 domain-containing protein [Nannocystaceae bacterium]|nr:DUF4178 domain-containing protein [Nannocystaceae bacterium]